MISEELKAIVDKFKEQGKMYFLEETTEDKISVFEEEKGITLPSKYKEWLLFSDGGELFLPAGVQFYGIEHKPLIDVDDNSRPRDSSEHTGKNMLRWLQIYQGQQIIHILDCFIGYLCISHSVTFWILILALV